jgi:peroxiredoxin
MEKAMLMPRQPAPGLTVPTLDHGEFDLASAAPARGTVICFYRGLHCPICATYLAELEKLTPAFAERGVETVAISSDKEERARMMADKIGAKALRIGHGLSLQTARDWGLYISTSRGKTSIGIEEPPLFSEPGLFLVNADRSIYYLSVQSMPFVRPSFRELLGAVDFAIDKNYPARGEYAGAV